MALLGAGSNPNPFKKIEQYLENCISIPLQSQRQLREAVGSGFSAGRRESGRDASATLARRARQSHRHQHEAILDQQKRLPGSPQEYPANRQKVHPDEHPGHHRRTR